MGQGAILFIDGNYNWISNFYKLSFGLKIYSPEQNLILNLIIFKVLYVACDILYKPKDQSLKVWWKTTHYSRIWKKKSELTKGVFSYKIWLYRSLKVMWSLINSSALIGGKFICKKNPLQDLLSTNERTWIYKGSHDF